MGLRRLFYILWVIIKYRLDELADTESAKGLPGFILRHGPWRLRKAPSDNVGERLLLKGCYAEWVGEEYWCTVIKWASSRSSSMDFSEICGCSAEVIANKSFRDNVNFL